jgi:hypothetical protein
MNKRFHTLIVGLTILATLVGCNSTPSVPNAMPQLQPGMQNITEEQYNELLKQNPIDRENSTSGTIQTRNYGSCSADSASGNAGQIAISKIGGSLYYWSVFMYYGVWSLSYYITVNGSYYQSSSGSAGYISASQHYSRIIITVQGNGPLGYTYGSLTCYVD